MKQKSNYRSKKQSYQQSEFTSRSDIYQFNWRRHWKKRVAPHLNAEVVQDCLDVGMRLLDDSWEREMCPHDFGGIVGCGVPRKGTLRWYQPIGRCHWIAFFSFAIGVINYPRLNWRFLSGERHTVVGGYWQSDRPTVVMDILCFDQYTAETSIERTCYQGESEKAERSWNEIEKVFVELFQPRLIKYAKSVNSGEIAFA